MKNPPAAVQLGGLPWSLSCAGGCYGPDTAPPPMLVIRIAIIRIAAAGVEESRPTIWEGILQGAPRPVKHFISTYIHAWIYISVAESGRSPDAAGCRS